MNIIDKNVKKNLVRYVFQCGIATAAILLILIFLNVLTHTAIIASLGATAFIVFTMPRAYSSGPKPLIGGYLIGIIVGCGCSLLSTLRFTLPFFITLITSYTIFGALAVGIAIFLMAVTNTEHAPAAGISLGLVLNDWNYSTLLFVFTAVLFMAGLKELLRPILIDLRDV
ncbi:MAG: HPP family protein [bacterium]